MLNPLAGGAQFSITHCLVYDLGGRGGLDHVDQKRLGTITGRS